MKYDANQIMFFRDVKHRMGSNRRVKLILIHSVDSATGSNSGLSLLLKGTSTRAGIEPTTP